MRLRPAYITLILSFMAVASGCSLSASRVPDEPIKAPESFIEGALLEQNGEGDKGGDGGPGLWWQGFEDERLDTLMEELFKSNLEIVKAFERVNEAEAALGSARARQFPGLSATGAGGRAKGITGTADTFKLSATAGYEVDLFKRLSSGARAARLDAAASREDLSALYISLSARFADLYYLAVEQRAQIELTDFTISAFEDTLERVEARYREGLVPALDVYQSRQNLAAARARRPLFEARLKSAEHALAVLLGRFPEKGIAGGRTTLPEPPEYAAGLASGLIARRPDISASMHRLRAWDARVAAAVADRFPTFNLVGEYGGASASLSSLLDTPNIFWNALVQAALPVIDGGRRKAEVRRNEAALRGALAEYRQSVLNAFKEVEDALSGARSSVERIGWLAERVEASESSLRIALERYMQGLSDYLPVLTEQQRLFDARSELIAAKRELISGRIGLARSLGGGWPAAQAEALLAEGQK